MRVWTCVSIRVYIFIIYKHIYLCLYMHVISSSKYIYSSDNAIFFSIFFFLEILEERREKHLKNIQAYRVPNA